MTPSSRDFPSVLLIEGPRSCRRAVSAWHDWPLCSNKHTACSGLASQRCWHAQMLQQIFPVAIKKPSFCQGNTLTCYLWKPGPKVSRSFVTAGRECIADGRLSHLLPPFVRRLFRIFLSPQLHNYPASTSLLDRQAFRLRSPYPQSPSVGDSTSYHISHPVAPVSTSTTS